MTRDEKEQFIRESWEAFKTDEDRVVLPQLSTLSEKRIDAMVDYYSYLWDK
ncbi:hypothetical protein [Brevibacillus choshinensis]|uniref:hypothetical protein n=1 Tax=Brevibacillus choshinensis TaxID=54911 RepID=UPI002E1FCA0D|nr:hypothetical protein [Brevibacillus choshinensis]